MDPWEAPRAMLNAATAAMYSACRPEPCSWGLRRKYPPSAPARLCSSASKRAENKRAR